MDGALRDNVDTGRGGVSLHMCVRLPKLYRQACLKQSLRSRLRNLRLSYLIADFKSLESRVFFFFQSKIMPKLDPLHIFNQVISGGREMGSRGSGVRGKQRRGTGTAQGRRKHTSFCVIPTGWLS